MPDSAAVLARRSARWLWPQRRWAYGTYMLLGVMTIPARTHFHLHSLRCDARLTAGNLEASLSKGPHIVMFAWFFLLTAAQFDRIDRRSMAWSLVATVALGILIEIEQGATRTGNCRYTDALPDLFGGLIMMAVVMAIVMVWDRYAAAQTANSQHRAGGV